jgi:hypothetical protein
MASVVSVLSIASFGMAANVLVLGDDASELEVGPALEAAGHTVDCTCSYYDWDGTNPPLRDFDVVVFLDGETYGQGLDPAAVAEFVSFVESGFGLVMTEWSAYDVCRSNLPVEIDGLMPVYMPTCLDYSYLPRLWSPVDPIHPMVAGLPSSWTDNGGFSFVEIKPGADVVIEDGDANPLLTWWNEPGGVVVHHNHAMRDRALPISAEALQVLINAVEFANAVVFRDGFESGDTTRWSASSP